MFGRKRKDRAYAKCKLEGLLQYLKTDREMLRELFMTDDEMIHYDGDGKVRAVMLSQRADLNTAIDYLEMALKDL